MITRTINESCTIKGIPFKKGMGVFIPVYALHRDEEFWPEPDCFKPERFLPEIKTLLMSLLICHLAVDQGIVLE